jgi:hypothetical protein
MSANDAYEVVTTGLLKGGTHSYGSQRAMRQSMTQGQGLKAVRRQTAVLHIQITRSNLISHWRST